MDDATVRLNQIFLAYAMERQRRLKEGNIRLVHYTKAEVAAKIIQNGEVYPAE